MKTRFTLLLAFAAVCCLLNVSCRTSLPQAKRAVISYYENGTYEKEVAACLKKAQDFLPPLGGYNAIGSAVIFDVDDTLLSTYEYQKALGFGHYGYAWHQWLEQGRATAIKPALDFFNLAKSRNVVIFIISGRREKFREITEDNLRSAGFDGWKALYLKSDDFKEKSVIPFKTAMRQRVEKLGYKIILNIGDNMSDLEGGHAEHTVLLPNLIYEVR